MLKGDKNPAKTKIYCGMLGRFGDILCFLPTVAKLKKLIPAEITFAVAQMFSSIKPLLELDPNIDRVFVTKFYLERFKDYCKTLDEVGMVKSQFYQGQYFDLRGPDELAEQVKHDLIFETRIWHRQKDWWHYRHVIQEYALHCGINLGRDELQIKLYPPEEKISEGKIIIHDEVVEYKKFDLTEVKEKLGENYEVITLKESPDWIKSAQLLRDAKLFIGVDSAPMWLASAFHTPTIGIYGINHFGEASESIYPVNPNATYLQSYKKDFSDITPERIIKEAIKKCQIKK